MLKFITNMFGSAKIPENPIHDSTEGDNSGFHTTLMREFYTIFANEGDIDVHFEDAGDVFYEGLGHIEPTVERLKSIDETDLENLLRSAKRILEADKVTMRQLRDVIRITLSHWDEEDTL